MGGEGPTIRDLANHFLSHKRSLLNTGELNDRTFQDYHATWARLVKVLGRCRLIDDIVAEDFLRYPYHPIRRRV